MAREEVKSAENKGKSYKKPVIDVAVYGDDMTPPEHRYRIVVIDQNSDEVIQSVDHVTGFVIAGALAPEAGHKYVMLCNHTDEDACVSAWEFLLRGINGWLEQYPSVLHKLVHRMEDYFRDSQERFFKVMFGGK